MAGARSRQWNICASAGRTYCSAASSGKRCGYSTKRNAPRQRHQRRAPAHSHTRTDSQKASPGRPVEQMQRTRVGGGWKTATPFAPRWAAGWHDQPAPCVHYTIVAWYIYNASQAKKRLANVIVGVLLPKTFKRIWPHWFGHWEILEPPTVNSVLHASPVNKLSCVVFLLFDKKMPLFLARWLIYFVFPLPTRAWRNLSSTLTTEPPTPQPAPQLITTCFCCCSYYIASTLN